ncbi:polysaccharide biosynthesis/export family protein, partial [Burkholderia pseudomallei]
FVTALGGGASFRQQLGVGAPIQLSIWEAPPATLFGAAQSDGSSGPATARVTVLPDQAIDGDGTVNIPFAGQVKAAGRSASQLAREIAARRKSMAHDPLVRV